MKEVKKKTPPQDATVKEKQICVFILKMQFMTYPTEDEACHQ